jgi:hypothetical protein
MDATNEYLTVPTAHLPFLEDALMQNLNLCIFFQRYANKIGNKMCTDIGSSKKCQILL